MRYRYIKPFRPYELYRRWNEINSIIDNLESTDPYLYAYSWNVYVALEAIEYDD